MAAVRWREKCRAHLFTMSNLPAGGWRGGVRERWRGEKEKEERESKSR